MDARETLQSCVLEFSRDVDIASDADEGSKRVDQLVKLCASAQMAAAMFGRLESALPPSDYEILDLFTRTVFSIATDRTMGVCELLACEDRPTTPPPAMGSTATNRLTRYFDADESEGQ